jgi:hypothetical protein
MVEGAVSAHHRARPRPDRLGRAGLIMLPGAARCMLLEKAPRPRRARAVAWCARARCTPPIPESTPVDRFGDIEPAGSATLAYLPGVEA